MPARTIKNGVVKINGRYYAPDARHMAYDGRMEGLRYVFGTYDHKPELVCMCGPGPEGADDYGPETVDGTLPWLFWHETNTLQRGDAQ